MKQIVFIELLLAIFLISGLPLFADPSSSQETSEAAAHVVVNEPRYEFGTVVEGTVVKKEYIIENKGNATLSILNVKTTCGCTTADYSKQIAPGEKGNVTINGNTRGYAGKSFSKTITVFTSDPKQKEIKLYVSGDVDAFASIEPDRIMLKGAPGEVIESKVTITPLKKYPFTITGSSIRLPDKKISYDLEKIKNQYILSVKNLVQEKGRYRGSINLLTDSTIKPEIIIYVSGIIEDKN
ncbi:MAG: DUF1573 domain-containing protein [Proteobacteria bacterium]|nr:DUF1573 domain-containing protein [Pseudomonadota bacterium]